MCVLWSLSNPRRCAWFVVLLALLTVAHLSTHTPHHDVSPAPPVACLHELPDHHEDEHAHTHASMTPSPTCAPSGHIPLIVAATAWPAETPAVPVAGWSSRSPPRNHRGRAAKLHTLEVCRC